MRSIIIALICLGVVVEPAMASPYVFWTSDPVGADDTVLAVGADLPEVTSVQVSRLADDPLKSDGDGPAMSSQVLQSDQHILKFLLPGDLAPGVYRWAFASGDTKVSGLLNAPTIYWFLGDTGMTASPGGWIRVLGRNVRRNDHAILELFGPRGDVRRLSPRTADIWDATFPVPAELPAGTWKMRLFNGEGNATTWVEVGSIDVSSGRTFSKKRIDVRSRGAVGDGRVDDGEAIARALTEGGAAGGAVVSLPRGVYRTTRALSIPPGVVLSGEHRDASFLVWPDMDNPPPVLLEGATDFAVEDLTVVVGRHRHVIHGGFPDANGGRDGKDIALRRIRIRASAFLGHLTPEEEMRRQKDNLAFSRSGVDSVGLAGRNLVVEDCDIYGSGRSLFLLRPRSARVVGNILKNGRQGWYSISGADGVIFADNVVSGADLESEGGGVNTLFAGVGASVNVLVRNNRFSNAIGWDGEALTSDGPGGFYFGSLDFSGGDVVRMLGKPEERPDLQDWRGAGVFLLSGRGQGIWARVVSRQGDTLKLDRRLPVVPERSDVVSIVPFQGRHLIIGNSFSDANIAVQIFGTGIENVIADNRSERTQGILIKALDYQHVQPTWYNQVLANDILSPSIQGAASIGVWGNAKDRFSGPVNFMTIVRRNRLLGNSAIELLGQYPYSNLVSDPLVEHNEIREAQRGILVTFGVARAVIRANRFVNVGQSLNKGP